MTEKHIYFDGAKSILLEQYPEEAWHTLTGSYATSAGERKLYQAIPWMFRGVGLRAGMVKKMPFVIETLKGKEVDNSRDYQNAVGWFPSPGRLFWQMEACATLTGRWYLWRQHTLQGNLTRGFRYLLPTSVEPKIDDSGLTGFRRTMQSQVVDAPVESIVYHWLPDPYVEIGPPESYPVKAALMAAGVLSNVDEFIAGFFKRGAIRATLLTVKGMPEKSEREKLEAWWKNVVAGVKNAFGAKVINADALTPVVIGDGLKELENQTLTDDKAKAIAVALGIPLSILFSDAANYATSERDWLNFLDTTIVPACELHEETLNEQVFNPAGYRLRFLPETLDAYQEDENDRAVALTQLTTAMESDYFEPASEILGYEIDSALMAKIQAIKADKEKQAEAIHEQMQQTEPEQADEDETPDNPRREELRRWERKALKAVERGKSAGVPFESSVIPAEQHARIEAGLNGCADAEAVKALFASEMAAKDDGTARLIDLLASVRAQMLEMA